MSQFDQIVVALGSVDGETSLIAHAALLARLGRAAEVRFVHVADPADSASTLRERMRARVAEPLADSGARVVVDVLHGSLTDRLLAYVTEFQADLILIGSKRHKLGARLAMVSPCSVAIVPHRDPATLSHLLVPIDFSDAAVETLHWVSGLAAGGGEIRCTALHVGTPESTDLFAGADDEAQQAAAMGRLMASALPAHITVEPRLVALQRTTDLGHSHPFSLAASIQGSDVAYTILREADACRADCIALSTRGRSRSASILLGSVTEKVIERATLPVLVRKHGGKNLGLASILLGHAGAPLRIKTN